MAEFNIVSATTPEGNTDEVLEIKNSSTENYRLADVISIPEQYTFSVWVKAATSMNVEFRVLGNAYTETVDTDWKKVVYTVDESTTTYIDICPGGDEALYLYKAMLQQGQFDTDWKPAPEDMATATEMQSSIQQLADSIELRVEKDGVISSINQTAEEVTINANRINLTDVFAQDITATGTITGATLNGAKLTGEAIDIESSDETGTTSIKTSVDSNGKRAIEIYDSGGSAGLKSYIDISNGTVRIAGQSLAIETDNLSTTASFIDSVNTYTTFDSDLISSGSVRVTRLLGKLCLLEGNLTLSGAASSTTVILDDTKVPANAAGTKYINLSNSQNSSFTRPLALRTTASGGLAMHYGAAARYDFSWLYVTS